MATYEKPTGGKLDELGAFRALGVCPLAAIDPLAWGVFSSVARALSGMGGLAFYPQRFAHRPLDEPAWYGQLVDVILAEKNRLSADKEGET